MKRMTMLAAVLALLACMEGHARAQGHEGGVPRMRCGDGLVSSLGLSDAQTAALATLRAQTESALSAVQAQVKTIHESIHTALSASSPDRCAIGGLLIQGEALHGEIETTLSGAEASFVASLTADQKTKYDTFVAAHPGCKVFGAPMGMHYPPGF